jgi:hypothetical protein
LRKERKSPREHVQDTRVMGEKDMKKGRRIAQSDLSNVMIPVIVIEARRHFSPPINPPHLAPCAWVWFYLRNHFALEANPQLEYSLLNNKPSLPCFGGKIQFG